MNKLIAMISLWIFSIILSILIMVYGWGLEVKSWWWVIGGGVVVRLFLAFTEAIAKSSE